MPGCSRAASTRPRESAGCEIAISSREVEYFQGTRRWRFSSSRYTPHPSPAARCDQASITRAREVWHIAPSRNLSSAVSEGISFCVPAECGARFTMKFLFAAAHSRRRSSAIFRNSRRAHASALVNQSRKFHSLSTAARKNFSRCPRGRTLRKDETCGCVRAARIVCKSRTASAKRLRHHLFQKSSRIRRGLAQTMRAARTHPPRFIFSKRTTSRATRKVLTSSCRKTMEFRD